MPERIENETATKFIYLLVCRICDDSAHTDELVFESPAARGQWATKHTRATGHDSWWVQDIPTNPAALALDPFGARGLIEVYDDEPQSPSLVTGGHDG